jgi:ribonuclease J
LGEIGLNCMALSYDQDVVVVDAGLMFPEAGQPGVELIIPDFSYLISRRDQIRGVVLTHGHEDHIGALAYLLKEIDAPVFGTRLTLALAKERLDECQIADPRLVEIKAGQTLALGQFQLEFIAVDHSILDGVALAATTPAATLVHTGDCKIDLGAPEGERTDLFAFARYGAAGVTCLMSDSTNADVPGTGLTEAEVGLTLTDIFREAEGRVVLACFASSLSRLRQAARAAKASGRKLLFDGRSMIGNVALARELGYLELSADDMVDAQQAQALDDRQVAAVVTGSQGEPLSALARMANGEHKHITVQPGDTIIFSARVIPGNERAIANLVNLFHGLGAKVVDNRYRRVHASGHGQAEELKLLLSLARPRWFAPIHGEPRQLAAHAELAKSLGMAADHVKILTNGRRLSLWPDGRAELGPLERTGRLLVDGNRLGRYEDPVIRRRLRLAESGLVYVVAVLDSETLAPLAPLRVNIHGVLYEDEPDLTLEAALTASETLEAWRRSRGPGPASPAELNELNEALRRETRTFFRRSINRRPLVWPEIVLAGQPAATEDAEPKA